MFNRIEEVSQESSPSNHCTKNLMDLFERSAKGRPLRNTLDEFTKELEQNLQHIDNKDVAGLESHRDPIRQSSRYRGSAGKTCRSELEESMIGDEQTRIFLEAIFPDYESNEASLSLKEFINKALTYFFPEQEFSPEEAHALRNRCRKLLTTTDENRVSINALKVVTKTSSLRVLLLEQIIRFREDLQHNIKTKEQEKILNEMASIEKELKQEREILNKKGKELKEREQSIAVREKAVVSRERQLKAYLQKEYEKLIEKSQKAIQQSVVEVDKKTSQIERNIKYKIQLLDKRIEDYQKIQQTQKQADTKLREKCIRLEKDITLMRSKCVQAEKIAAQFIEEKEALVKKLLAADEKIGKLSGRVASLKEDLTASNRKLEAAVAREEQSSRELAIIKDTKQKEEIVPKREVNNEPAVKLLGCLLTAAEKTIPKILSFYRQQPNRELDFQLAEVFYQKSPDLLHLYQDLFAECLSTKQQEAILSQHSPIVSFMTSLSLFTLNCNYSRQKQQLLPNALEENEALLKKSTDKRWSVLANDKLSSKILKALKKTNNQSLVVEYALWGLVLAQTDTHVQTSLSYLLKAVLNHQQAKAHLVRYQCFTCLLLKCTSSSSSDQTLSHMLDLLLEYCSIDSLSDTLLKLEEFQNYQLLLSIVPRLQHRTQLLERLSIILQRYSYVYKKDMVVPPATAKCVREIIRTHQSNRDSLISANFSAIIQSSL